MLQQPLQDTRGFRSRYINALNAAVKSLTPIAGRGIRLRQSAQGTVIESTAKSTAGGKPFAHRWKCVASYDTDAQAWVLSVSSGSVWQEGEAGLILLSLVPEAPVQTADGGWQVTPATTGSLYISRDKDGDDWSEGATRLKFGDPSAEEGMVLVRVADMTISTGTPASATVTQRQVGDAIIGLGGGGGATSIPPSAWVVRRLMETDPTTGEEHGVWKVYSPAWCSGRDTVYPAGMEAGWNDLAVTDGTLYAVRTWEGTKGDAGEATWTPGVPSITNSLADVPEDDDPSGEGSSAQPGHRSVIVPIGTFDTSTATGETSFAQIHVGVIVETVVVPFAAPASASGWVVGNNAIIQIADGDGTKWVERAYFGTVTTGEDGTPSVSWTSQVAWERDVVPHSEDHTPGVL